MKTIIQYIFATSIYPVATLADLLTPRYPAPVDLTSENSLVAKAWRNISETFDGHLNGTVPSRLLTGAENLTFSAGLFSIHDPRTQNLQYHYTAPEIKNSEVGVKTVDGNSIYRFASVSKLFTAYAGVVALTEEQWGTPLTKILPELEIFIGQNSDPSKTATITQWDKVTPFSLAAHLSGVIGNAPPFTVVDAFLIYALARAANDTSAVDPTTYGMPPHNWTYPYFNPSCLAADATCTQEQYIFEARTRAPTFQPWTSPAYSNHGYTLLGIALSKLTKQPLNDVYRKTLFEPLGMQSSYALDPLDQVNRSVIPGGLPQSFFTNSGVATASGGIFSTLNDLARFSTSILNSTLIPPERTRKWMKPLSHTASVYYSVGAPWEIMRYIHPAGTPSAGVVTDIYTKTGNSGPNGGAVVLIPDYGAGFNLIAQSSLPLRSSVQGLVFDAIARQLIPALEAQAAIEAEANFSGVYKPDDPNLNTTLVLKTTSLFPGLGVVQWISNSSDVLANQATIFSNSDGLRLLPTIVEKGNSKYAFRFRDVVNQTNVDLAMGIGPLTGFDASPDWFITGQQTYAGEPLDLVLFDVDHKGKASSLFMTGFNVTLIRQE